MDATKYIVYGMRGSAAAGLIRLAVVLAAALTAGCAVPQQRGAGQQFHKIEPQTSRGYWLYLPEDYAQGIRANPNRRWPVVVTFHGMKPFDRASAQAREWQYEADNYGLIVIAPELKTSDLMMEFPLRKMHNYVREDERAVLNVMEQVFRTTQADSTRVLASSWSSGGYMAHYMVNRHPNLFTCLAPRQSNFSASILDEANVPYYQDMPIGVFFGQNDFDVCRKESVEAIRWYKEHNFKFVDGRVVIGLGHERTPQTGAAFFARVSKPPILPVRPALAQETLARLRLVPAEFAGISDLAPTEPTLAARSPADELTRPNPPLSNRSPADELARPVLASAQNGGSVGGASPSGRAGGPNRPRLLTGTAGSSGSKAAAPPAPPTPAQPAAVNIRVVASPKIGLAPLYVSFDVQAPTEILQGGSCLWTDNDEPICNSPTGQRIITATGDHVLCVILQTKDRHEYRAWTTVKVLSPQPAMR
jgi:poly(3-hydroxybutyrate) depolymerase